MKVTNENLRGLIKKSKFRTQERFAESIGINESIISKYCRGIRSIKDDHRQLFEQILSEQSASDN